MNVFEYGELRAEYDVTDYVFLEAYQTAVDSMFSRISALVDSTIPVWDKMKSQVDIICETFDSAFGAGSGNKALGGSTSVKEATQAAASLISTVNQADADGAKEISNIFAEYGLSANRATRRAAKKK